MSKSLTPKRDGASTPPLAIAARPSDPPLLRTAAHPFWDRQANLDGREWLEVHPYRCDQSFQGKRIDSSLPPDGDASRQALFPLRPAACLPSFSQLAIRTSDPLPALLWQILAHLFSLVGAVARGLSWSLSHRGGDARRQIGGNSETWIAFPGVTRG